MLMSILEVADSKGNEELLPAFKGTLPGHEIILIKEILINFSTVLIKLTFDGGPVMYHCRLQKGPAVEFV